MSASPKSVSSSNNLLKAPFRHKSIQAELDANDVHESANEPGPGHYFGPGSEGFSSLGKQKFSKAKSEPYINIPRTGWDKWQRVTVSKQHSITDICKESEGHLYHPSLNPFSDKAAKIGTSLRPDITRALGVDPDGAPGVGTYEHKTTMNIVEARSNKDRDGQKYFGKAHRFSRSLPGQVGPGQYEVKGNALRFDTGRSFSVAGFNHKVIANDNWKFEGQCSTSPGVRPPGWTDITKDGSRACSIGRANRFPKPAGSHAPGPGQYDRNERDIANLDSRCSDTIKPANVKFGKQPKKPRYRQGLAMLTSERGCWGYF